MIYSDIIENNKVSDTKTLLLRCIPFISKAKIGDISSTGQYMNYHSFTFLHLEKVIKKLFLQLKNRIKGYYR